MTSTGVNLAGQSLDKPWHAAYPSPKTKAASITSEQLLSWMLDDQKIAGRDFVLVDLRRTDYEGGTIRGSINLPAQSLYATIPALYTLFSSAGIRNVIWYCGSSRGRGQRAAGWFADYINEQNESEMKSRVLESGIGGWVGRGEVYTRLMDEFDATAWE